MKRSGMRRTCIGFTANSTAVTGGCPNDHPELTEAEGEGEWWCATCERARREHISRRFDQLQRDLAARGER